MENNDILKRLRYTFDYGDDKMMEIFELADHEVTRALLSDWLKKEDHEEFVEMTDYQLAVFLNGLIVEKRGRKEGEQPEPEEELDNNLILRKIKIALNLKSHDIVDVLSLAGRKVSPTEISAFLRNPSHRHYKYCNDQYLRGLMSGIQKKYRTDDASSNEVKDAPV